MAKSGAGRSYTPNASSITAASQGQTLGRQIKGLGAGSSKSLVIKSRPHISEPS